MTAQPTFAAATFKGRALSVALWGTQGVLAAGFLMAGATKLLTPAADLAAMIPWTGEYGALVTFTGLVDLAAGFGILLPTWAALLFFLSR